MIVRITAFDDYISLYSTNVNRLVLLLILFVLCRYYRRYRKTKLVDFC